MFNSIRNNQKPYVIGHRGAKAHCPENTMASFKKGLALGADLIECDVHLTRDGHLVVIHDPTLDRTTNGIGPVANHTLTELKHLDAGQGEKIPTLGELLDWVRAQPTLGIAIELKPSGERERVVEKVIAAIRERSLADRAIVISFDWKALKLSHELAPELATGALYHEKHPDVVSEALALGATALLPHLDLATPETTKAAHARGLGVFTWTANSIKDVERVLRAGVDGIASDAPDLVRSCL